MDAITVEATPAAAAEVPAEDCAELEGFEEVEFTEEGCGSGEVIGMAVEEGKGEVGGDAIGICTKSKEGLSEDAIFTDAAVCW
jgi:hypothetical protein